MKVRDAIANLEKFVITSADGILAINNVKDRTWLLDSEIKEIRTLEGLIADVTRIRI